MTNVVRLREDIDTLPCEVEFDRRVLIGVHIANTTPVSALDGRAPDRKSSVPWMLLASIIVAAVVVWRFG